MELLQQLLAVVHMVFQVMADLLQKQSLDLHKELQLIEMVLF